MSPISHVVHFEFNGQSMGIYKWGVDWLFIMEDQLTGEVKGNLCLCFEQASDLMDVMISRGKVWVN